VKHLLQVMTREIRMGLRNPWAYSFMGLFALFMLSLLLINSKGYIQGYSGVSGTMLNLILYLLPLMTLMLGSFSLTGEKEEGNWELLSTYSLGTLDFIGGKYIGLGIVLLSIIAVGFGFAGVLGWAGGAGFQLDTYMLLLAFSASLALMFLAISFLIGSLARNRWQALTICIGVWFFLIIAWQPLLIALLGSLPYMWVKPMLAILTALNPAELSRLMAVIKLGGGSIIGPEYYDWVKWLRQPSGTWSYLLFAALWIFGTGGIACWLWERGRGRG